MAEEPIRQPDMSGMPGWKFLLFILLPLLIVFAGLFIAFAPDEPLGGPNRFGAPTEDDIQPRSMEATVPAGE